MKIVYTLSGGAAYGYAHVGVLKFLEEKNIRPEGIAGTSIGAIVGGLYAYGYKAAQIEQIAEQVRSIELVRLFFPSFPRGGIIDTDGIRDFFHGFVKNVRIEDLPIPYRSVAVDVETGEEIVFDRGPLIDAMIASMSIPAVFKPFRYYGRELVDGGLLNNLPLDVGETLGDTHIVINVAPSREVPRDGPLFSSSILSEAEDHQTASRGRGHTNKAARDHEKQEKGEKNEAFGEQLRSLIAGIKKREETLSIKDLVTSLNRSKGEKDEYNSIPEIITKVMAIIRTGTRIPSKGKMRTILYLHPELEKFNLNDFHKSEEIIEIGYNTALRDDDFQKKLEKVLKKI